MNAKHLPECECVCRLSSPSIWRYYACIMYMAQTAAQMESQKLFLCIIRIHSGSICFHFCLCVAFVFLCCAVQSTVCVCRFFFHIFFTSVCSHNGSRFGTDTRIQFNFQRNARVQLTTTTTKRLCVSNVWSARKLWHRWWYLARVREHAATAYKRKHCSQSYKTIKYTYACIGSGSRLNERVPIGLANAERNGHDAAQTSISMFSLHTDSCFSNDNQSIWFGWILTMMKWSKEVAAIRGAVFVIELHVRCSEFILRDANFLREW